MRTTRGADGHDVQPVMLQECVVVGVTGAAEFRRQCLDPLGIATVKSNDFRAFHCLYGPGLEWRNQPRSGNADSICLTVHQISLFLPAFFLKP